MIEVSHLSKRYGHRSAIEDLSFSVSKGEIIGFLGPNGAGKSTTMKIITAFMPATSGTCRVAGHDVFEEPLAVKRKIGYLPENPPVYTDMTVTDYLTYVAELNDLPRNKIKSAVNLAMEKTVLGDVRGRLIGNLSKGYRQRVGIAQALVHDPEVLILDEPTVGLDPKQIIEIREMMKGLKGAHTVILSTHILPEVTATCERIIVINKGRIITTQKLDEMGQQGQFTLLLRKPKTEAAESLKSLTGVEHAELHGNRLVLTLSNASDEVKESVVTAAVEKGLGVIEVHADRANLEDIFLSLIREDA